MNLCSDGCGVTSNKNKQFFSCSDSSDLSINSFLNAPKHTHVSYGRLDDIPFQPPDPAAFLGASWRLRLAFGEGSLHYLSVCSHALLNSDWCHEQGVPLSAASGSFCLQASTHGKLTENKTEVLHAHNT